MRRLAAIIVFLTGGIAAAGDSLPPGAVLRLGDTRFRALGEVRHLRFSDDGQTLYAWAAGPDGGLRPVAWDVPTGVSVLPVTIPSPPDVPDRTTPAARLDADRVVTAGPGAAGRVWDAHTGRQLAVLVGHSAPVTAATVSCDGKRIATGSADGLVRLWAADRLRPLASLAGHTSAVRSIQVAATGKRALTLGDDGTARVWDLASGRELRGFQTAGPASLTPDGQFVVLPAATGCQVRDVVTGLEVVPPDSLELPVESLDELLGRLGFAAAGSPDGRLAAVARRDGGIALYEMATGQVRRMLPGHGTTCRGLAFTPDGSRLLSAGADHTVLVWPVQVRDMSMPEIVRRETRAGLLWTTLTTGRADSAYLAMARLAAEPSAALKMARLRLTPAHSSCEDANASITLADVRGIELLEALGTPGALEFLEELAAGDPSAQRTREARGAVLRLLSRR